MTLNKKKIAFLLTSSDISGGIYVVFEHAVRLNRRYNYEVYIVIEDKPNKSDLNWYPEACELKWLTFDESENILFDAVISTWWLTCYYAYRLKSKSYIYFNQSVESRFYKSDEILLKKYAESTYFLGMKVITEATWIKEYLYNNYGTVAELVLNGIRKDVFVNDGLTLASRATDKLRVLIEGPLGVFFKNTEKAIDLCIKSNADEVWLMTSSNVFNYNGVDRVISRIPFLKTPEVYRSCDILVKLSYVEGMFGPPLEMFHCGGTAIVYDVTGHEEYIKDGYNAFVLETDDEKGVIECINELKKNPDVLQRLKKGAVETANNWGDWDSASIKFELALEKLVNNDEIQISQFQLKNKTLHFKEWYDYTSQNNSNFKNIYLMYREYFLCKKTIKFVKVIMKKVRSNIWQIVRWFTNQDKAWL